MTRTTDRLAAMPDHSPTVPNILPDRCRHPRPPCVRPSGKTLPARPCGRARCSQECRRRWAAKWAWILRRSFETRPPTHEIRLTAKSHDDGRVGKWEKAFCRRLRRRKVEYFLVREWKNGVRHCHIALAAKYFSLSNVRTWWRSTVTDWRVNPTSHVRSVRSARRLAKYLVKDLRAFADGRVCHEGPPGSFRGRLVFASRGFLAKPPRELYRELVAQWRSRRGTA